MLITISVATMVVSAILLIVLFRWIYNADGLCPKCHRWQYKAKQKSLFNTTDPNLSIEKWTRTCSACGYNDSWYYKTFYDGKGTKKRTYYKEKPEAKP